MQLLKNSDSFIDAQLVLPQLFDLLISRGIDSHVFLRGSGIFYQDIQQADFRISPAQLMQLQRNISQIKNNPDIGFLYGESLLQNPQQQLLNLLMQAKTWSQALEQVCRYARLLTPLHRPYLLKHNGRLYLYWLSSFSNNEEQVFAMQCYCGLISSLHKLLLGHKPRWRLYLQHKQPTQIELYKERFGACFEFEALANVMVFEQDCELSPLQNLPQQSEPQTEQQLEQQLQCLPAQQSLIDYIYQSLRQHNKRAPDLDAMAARLEISPASLKRHLKQHQTSFQNLLDLSRSHLALYYLYCQQASNDEIAQQLNFHDSRNFRRSFKRWTGYVPSAIRASLNR